MTQNAQNAGPVVMFPGQGGYDGAALTLVRSEFPQVRAVFERIDTVTRQVFSRGLSELLFGPNPPELADLRSDEPWVSQLAIYGSGLAAHRVLVDHGMRPAVLMGHSLGEITALVAAGAYTIEDGARIIARRTELIVERSAAAGAMVALTTDPVRAGHLVGVVNSPLLAIATENHDAQTVLSGPRVDIQDVKAIAERVRIGCVPLDAAFAFHSPALADVAPEFAAYVRQLNQRPLTGRVYSPILRRFYEPGDALAERLADHLTQPVKFSTAVRELHARGHRVFVEAGGRTGLSALVPKVLGASGDAGFTALATVAVGRAGASRLPDTLLALRARALVSTVDSGGWLRRHLAPEATQEEFEEFWVNARAEITALVAERLAAFRSAGARGAAAEPVPSAPTAQGRATELAGRPYEPGATASLPGAGTPSDAEPAVPPAAERGVPYAVEPAASSAPDPAVPSAPEPGTPTAAEPTGTAHDAAAFGAGAPSAYDPAPPVAAPRTAAEASDAQPLGGAPLAGDPLTPVPPGTEPRAAGAPAAPDGRGADVPGARSAAVPGRGELFTTVRSLYAQALEYPEEVFTPDALLEAELGVDSVKQVELLSRVSRHYGLPERPADFQLTEYETLDKVVTLIESELGGHRWEGATR